MRILDVNQLPRVSELRLNLYTWASLARGGSLGELELSQEISWPSHIIFARESMEPCLTEMSTRNPSFKETT
ncbi:hypothetical protein AMTR_s00014p00237350 [Amborella trichopoda]|uniref:Uncharacterized protein n=1 Tax=Amborella trichopoda TaxID=13333 RepID=W1PN29_AMBTC|nr:hypothetical protein AMTR_s00014p00237350 [Amborella trichopoda]